MNEVIREIAKKLNRANDIALYCHTNPDGDALGSMLALFVALKKSGKNVVAYCDSPVPVKYTFLPSSEEITFPEKRVHELAISIDVCSIDRLGKCMKSFLSAKEQIAIDHHGTFERFASLCLVDKDAAACAEIVFELLTAMKMLDATSAELLFCGIVTDTGCFSYSSVTKRTHEIACKLLEYDFDSQDVISKAFRIITPQKFDLKRRVLSKAKIVDGNIAFLFFMKEDFQATSTCLDDTEGIISELNNIDSVKVSYALAQVGERNFKLSIRTKDNVDAADIAMTFGGGGHKFAAGCRVNGYLEDIVEKLIKLAKDRI